MSLAAFLFPNLDKEIEPFDSMVKLQGMIKNYKKVKYGDFLLNSMKRKMEGKTHTEMAKNWIQENRIYHQTIEDLIGVKKKTCDFFLFR